MYPSTLGTSGLGFYLSVLVSSCMLPSPDVPVATAPVTPVTTSTAVSTPSSGPVASIEDVPIKAIDILLVIVAQKLKKCVDKLLLSKSIKDLVGVKSTLQNEILGDLQQEFASAPEKGEELGSALGDGFSGTLGKYSTSLISCLIGGKMTLRLWFQFVSYQELSQQELPVGTRFLAF